MTEFEKACTAFAEAMATFMSQMVAMGQESKPESGTKLYSFEDLAGIFGKTKGTIRQWACAGEFGELVKAGKSTLVTQAGLDKYIADHSGPAQGQERARRTRSSGGTTSKFERIRL
ncbi:MAG: helix-turn-helix domain-containing protein [Acutalibacter sp.]|nr:helix-turn-helix domain-containing protein [Acutalibacter sp.]